MHAKASGADTQLYFAGELILFLMRQLPRGAASHAAAGMKAELCWPAEIAQHCAAIFRQRNKAKGEKKQRGRNTRNTNKQQRISEETAGLPGADADALAAASSKSRVIRASSSSQANRMAGSIAHTARRGDPPSVSGIGAACVNLAVKAIIIARRYVAENDFDLIATAHKSRVGPNALHFKLRKSTAPATSAAALAVEPLKCGASTKADLLGGAVAGRLRDGERVAILAVGANAVRNVAQAIIKARKYLRGDGLEVSFKPSFVELPASELQGGSSPKEGGAAGAAEAGAEAQSSDAADTTTQASPSAGPSGDMRTAVRFDILAEQV